MLGIVIASRNEFRDLLWTLQGLAIELRALGDDWRVTVALDDGTPGQADRLRATHLAHTGHLEVVLGAWHSAAGTRHAGVEVAGLGHEDHLLFIDSHIMVKPGALRGAYQWHQSSAGLLALGVNYFLADDERGTVYQYRWNPAAFWGELTSARPQPPDYRILLSGMQVMMEAGVYYTLGGFPRGLGIYGGEEPWLYLKAAMWGYPVRCLPQYQVYHHAEARGYCWTNDDIWQNFMTVAYILGGHRYLGPVYEHFCGCCNEVPQYLSRTAELEQAAIAAGSIERAQVREHALKSLDQVLAEMPAAARGE